MWLLPLAMGIGIALTFQTAINTQLRDYVQSPLQAALFSFLIGTILLCFLVFVQNSAKPNFGDIIAMPWYLWIGGCLGVYAISMSLFAAPKLGLLTLSGLIIFVVFFFVCSFFIFDIFDRGGGEETPINWQRFLGGVVIFIGVLLTLQR